VGISHFFFRECRIINNTKEFNANRRSIIIIIMQIHDANNDADSAILALLAGGFMYLFHATSA